MGILGGGKEFSAVVTSHEKHLREGFMVQHWLADMVLWT